MEMETYGVIFTVLSSLWVFLLGWVIKIQKDVGGLMQKYAMLTTDAIENKQQMDLYMKKTECELTHKNTVDGLQSFKESVNARLERIEDMQDEIAKDIKILLTKK